MAFLPAICTNPKCGLIFQSPILMQGSDNTFINIHYGICHKCGSVGRIPDGVYSGLGEKVIASLFNISDVEILKEYSSYIVELLKKGYSPDNICNSSIKKFPKFKFLTDLIPKSRADAYAFISIMVALIGLAVECSDKLANKEPTIEIKQEIINQSFDNFYISGDSVSIYLQQNNTELNKK